MAPWLNWIEQPPPKGQVAGSNPAGVANTFLSIGFSSFLLKVWNFGRLSWNFLFRFRAAERLPFVEVADVSFDF